MKLKQIEQFLQQVDDFDKPKIKYEQYATNAHLAAHMIFNATNVFDDIKRKYVADLGCGCGMLSIAAALLGAEKVYSVDIDPDALAICRQNLIDLGFIDDVEEEEENSEESYDDASDTDESSTNSDNTPAPLPSSGEESSSESSESSEPYDLVEMYNGDVLDEEFLKSTIACNGNISTVIMNPPFGTKNNAGVDVAFIKAALSLKDSNPLQAIYSMHKSSTRDYLQSKAKEWGCEFTLIAEMKFDLPAKYAFHKKDNVTVAVDLIRFGVRK